jgi:polyisoprenoid-binding protein YceI
MTPAVDPLPAGASEPALADGRWDVDAERSELGFAVREMWGLRTVRGLFTAFDGGLEVRAGEAAGELTIEAGSLDTGNRRRDEHLRSPAFFDVERQPRIVFTTTAVSQRDAGLAVVGELAIGAARTRLEIPVEATYLADGALRLEGTTTVSRKAAGLTWNKLGTIRDGTVLHAQLTLVRALR